MKKKKLFIFTSNEYWIEYCQSTNKTTSYFTSKIVLFKNNRGIATQDLQDMEKTIGKSKKQTRRMLLNRKKKKKRKLGEAALKESSLEENEHTG